MTTLYFDETNNHRSISIRDNGKINISDDDQDFILGGIGFPSSINSEEQKEKIKSILISSMGFNKGSTPKDIKLKTLAQGNFLECLKSQKLKNLISEIKKKGLFIHYYRTNIAFWNTLDIIESLLVENKLTLEKIKESKKAKEELLNLYREKKIEFLCIFKKYNYPDIQTANIQSFYKEIYLLCKETKGTKSLKKFLKIGARSKSAAFIQQNTPLVLIKDFSSQYIFCIEMHKKYCLIFDHEKLIEDDVENYFKYKKLEINYKFIEKDFFLQISDVIVGLLGKLYSYANKKNISEIKKDLIGINDHQQAILSDLKEIMTYTQNSDPKLGFETATTSCIEKQKFIINHKKQLNLTPKSPLNNYF